MWNSKFEYIVYIFRKPKILHFLNISSIKKEISSNYHLVITKFPFSAATFKQELSQKFCNTGIPDINLC